jgi:pimeloyl-ACP methyl ester carboxylesterase/quercetin dioxygenase-like cupin family protein
MSANAEDKIVRKELGKAEIGPRTISTVGVREIIFQPGQMTGLHRHPCPVISYIVEGTIKFQVRGQPMQMLHAGQVCHEPADTVIEHFDNASDYAPAKFIPYYLLNGQKELIEMLPESASAEPAKAPHEKTPPEHATSYLAKQIDGLSIFYREAGPKDVPTILLLHGLPSSSRMFDPLFARLSDRYHLIAPDYPGFGQSDWPDPKKFAYTFDHIAGVMNHFTEALGLAHYTLYMQDYGVPVGFRMILAHPERVEALIVQDGVAHNEGLGANWKTRRAFWADRAPNEEALRTNLLSLATTRTRHVGDDPNTDRYDPDLWTDEFYFLNRPWQAKIQSDLFYDYRTNVEAYPKWQAWMQAKQPRLLVIWGRHDLSFDFGEPERYRKDVPTAEVHVLDAGHFALDTAADEIAQLVRNFMQEPGRER